MANAKIVFTAEDRTKAAFNSLLKNLDTSRRAMDTLKGLAAGALSVAGLTAFVNKNAEAERSANRLTAVINAQGHAAGFTRRQLDEMADSMAAATQFDDEAIRDAQAELLKFGNIYDDVFERALRVSADLAAFQGTELAGGIDAVGKALQNPAEGMRTLEQQIGKLDPAQKEVIKNLVAQNRVLEAQNMLLDIVQGKIGGTAELMNTGYSRAISGVTKQWDEFIESLGKTRPVQGLVTSFFGFLEQSLKDLKSIIETGDWFAGLLFLLGGRGHITGGDEIEQRLKSYRTQLEALRKLLQSSNLTPDQKSGIGIQIKQLEERIASDEELLRMARRAETKIATPGSGLKPKIGQEKGKTTTKHPIGEEVKNLLALNEQFFQQQQTAQQFGQAALAQDLERVGLANEILELKRSEAAFEASIRMAEAERMRPILDQADEYVRALQFESDAMKANSRQRTHMLDMLALEQMGLAVGSREYDEYAKKIEKVRANQQKLNESWEFGATLALQRYVEEVRNTAQMVDSAITGGLLRAEDALVEFVRTGKLQWRSLADYAVDQLIRINMVQPALAKFSEVLGAGLSSLFPGTAARPANAEHFASGGSFIVGGSGGVDTTPVGFMATPGERVTVETPSQQRMGGGVVIHQHIHVDSRSDQASIIVAMRRAKDEAVAEVQNQFYRGGRMAKAAGTA